MSFVTSSTQDYLSMELLVNLPWDTIRDGLRSVSFLPSIAARKINDYFNSSFSNPFEAEIKSILDKGWQIHMNLPYQMAVVYFEKENESHQWTTVSCRGWTGCGALKKGVKLFNDTIMSENYLSDPSVEKISLEKGGISFTYNDHLIYEETCELGSNLDQVIESWCHLKLRKIKREGDSYYKLTLSGLDNSEWDNKVSLLFKEIKFEQSHS